MTDQAQQPQDPAKRIREISLNVKELIDLIRKQNDELRKKGLKLPGTAMSELKHLKARLDKVQKEYAGKQIELTQLRALADTTALITSTLDVDEVLNQVMDTVIRLTGAERGYIMLKNHETNEMEFRIARGMAQEQLDNNEFIVSRTIVNRVVGSGEPVLTDNASDDERFQGQDSIVGFALRSILAVPLQTRGETVGVVYCDNRILQGLFRQHEMNLLTAFADQAAVAVENARLFADARSQLNEVTSIRDLMENIFSSVASGIMTLSIDGTVTTVNSAAETVIGQRKTRILGRKLVALVPEGAEVLQGAMTHVARSGRQQVVELQPMVNDTPREWNFIVSPLTDIRDNSVQGLAVVVDDLTELKQREAQLAQVRRYVPMAGLDTLKAADLLNIQVEVRQITALFCDVRGFTSFSENLQPEELMRVINKYLSLASDAINLYEGVVDKYMGDAVTGLFNTQLNPQDDHASRGVRAAMNMVMDLYALHEVLPEEQRLFYGTGIHTGPAVLGNVGGGGREEFSAMGDAMEISKVLQENAGPGEIIISQQTYDHVQELFECEPIEPRKTKGYDIDVMYKVLKRKQGSTTGPLMLDPELMALLGDDFNFDED
ncbi:MAG: GAF domain-containing protein [Chloroflexota bacterium]